MELSSPEAKQLLLQKSLSQAFWQRTRHSLSLSQIEEWKKLNQVQLDFQSFSTSIKEDPALILDHFYIVFSENTSLHKSPENHFKIQQKISHLLEILKNADLKEIQKFIESQKLSKADKILAVLYTLYYGSSEEKTFDLMKALQVSVNDSLSFKEIKSLWVPESLQNTDGIAIVLSHHLLAANNPLITNKLLEQNIDLNLKPVSKNNLINFYILSNQNLTKKELAKLVKGLKAFLQIPQAQSLLTDKNSAGFMPIHFAFSHPDKKMRQIFLEEMQKLSLNPQAVQANIKSQTASLWDYIEAREQTAFSESKLAGDITKVKLPKYPDIAYLNFQAFSKNLLDFFDPYQDEESRLALANFLAEASLSLMDAEQARLSVIYNILSKEQRKEFKNIALILKAIINREDSIFKTLNIQTDTSAEHLFANFIYKSNGHAYLLTNLLSEAIRHSFAPAVDYLLKISRKFPSAQHILKTNKNAPLSFNLDPLSLAFISYGSLDSKDPLKSQAKEIIQLLYDSLPDFENFNWILTFSPVEWALLLGLKEEVQFLNESKKVEISPQLTFGIDSRQWLIDWESYTSEQGFKNLTDYLKQIKTADPELGTEESPLEDVISKIFQTASENTRKAFTKISTEDLKKQVLGPKLWKKYQKGQLRLKDLEEDPCKKIFN